MSPLVCFYVSIITPLDLFIKGLYRGYSHSTRGFYRPVRKKTGLFNDKLNGSQDYDFILRTCEQAQRICHIPKVLYHWRKSASSVAGDPEQKKYAYDAAVRALQNHLKRCHVKASVTKDLHFGYYSIRYALPDPLPVISIYMSHCTDDLADRIRETSAWPPSHLEFVSSPSKATGQVTVMLYHVHNIWEADWLDKLAANVLRPEISMAAGRSFVRRNTLPFMKRDQQKPGRRAYLAALSLKGQMLLDNGLILTSDGQLHSPFFGYKADSPGYCYHAVSQRFVSFVSPYCYAVKTKELALYMQQNKEKLQRAQNSPWDLVLGLCLESRKQGRYITALPSVSVLCETDRREHLPTVDLPKELPKESPDPYYNPNFSEGKMYQLPLKFSRKEEKS